jgi:2-iminoacetate synthase ThiH
MKDKHPSASKLTPEEQQLIQRLREHPELMERFQSILEISSNAEGRLKRADEIEAVLIEEMRRLGKASLESWAGGAERRLSEELQQKDASAVVRKKKR